MPNRNIPYLYNFENMETLEEGYISNNARILSAIATSALNAKISIDTAPEDEMQERIAYAALHIIDLCEKMLTPLDQDTVCDCKKMVDDNA